MGFHPALETGAEPFPDALGRADRSRPEPLKGSCVMGTNAAWSANGRLGVREAVAPFPVSPSGGKPGREGAPHAGGTLRGQQKTLAPIVRRLPPQEGCRPLVHPLRARHAKVGNLREDRNKTTLSRSGID